MCLSNIVPTENIHWPTIEHYQRYEGLDLERYARTISGKQLDALLDYAGEEKASPDFDPCGLYYPDDIV